MESVGALLPNTPTMEELFVIHAGFSSGKEGRNMKKIINCWPLKKKKISMLYSIKLKKKILIFTKNGKHDIY